MSFALNATLLDRRTLTSTRIAEMYALFRQYYDGVTESIFYADLMGKDYVIELRHDDALAGFSTIALFDFFHEPSQLEATVMFSGDTIIDHRFWGSQALPAAFGKFAGEIQARRQKPLYWLLISKGHRTYRYLPLFVREYWPRHDRPTPTSMEDLLNAIALRRFGRHYDASIGLLRFPSSRGHLKEQWAEVHDAALDKPAVRFFLERNPRYAQGEELVCLAEFNADNLRGVVQRSFIEAAQCAALAL